MTPQRLRERRRARIEKLRQVAESAAMAEVIASMCREPTWKDLVGAIVLAAVIVGSILFFTL